MLLSWAPLAGFSAVLAAVYINSVINPSKGPPRTYTEVPQFLKEGMLKVQADRATAAAAKPAATKQPSP